MATPDYTYVFSPIGERLNTALLIDHRIDAQATIEVATSDQHLYYQGLFVAPPQIADMVDLGLAVYIADRFSKRASKLPCHIHITLPVRAPALFNQSKTLQMLRDVLYWYTDDNWSFSFEQRTTARRPAELQGSFHPSLGDLRSTEIALWSGGLDSFAGLWRRLNEHPETRYVLLGTGPNHSILCRQRDLFRKIRDLRSADVSLTQIPLHLRTPRRMPRNRYQRTRGFVFLLLGAVCAHLEGQSALHIYENGIGALNLPCREAEVGLDHGRPVHPLSLLKMQDLVSYLLESSFMFINPFLFQTKAELCARLHGSLAELLIPRTISCDSRPRRPGRPPQCGGCSSCLLRRQALAVIDVEDQTPYDRKELNDINEHLPLAATMMQVAMLRECFASSDPWLRLRMRYPSLVTLVDRLSRARGETSELLIKQLLRLYSQYVREWDYAQSALKIGHPHTMDQAA